MQLQEALRLYLLVDRARSTQQTYEQMLSRFVADLGPRRRLENITPEDLDAYIADLRGQRVKYADHPSRPVINEPLSPATIAKWIKTIKAFFNWCVRREYIPRSPARYLSNRRPARIGEGKAARPDEVTEVLAAARYKPRDRAIVWLLAQSGCRAGDVAGLRIDRLDLPNCRAVVDGKGGKRRTIHFEVETAEALAAWLAVRPAVDHPYVFTSTRGKGPLTPAAVSQIVRRLCRTAGLERGLGAHAFRHYVGMTLARNRVAPTVIQQYLGHSNILTTMGYCAVVEDDDLRAASRLLSRAEQTPVLQLELRRAPGGWGHNRFKIE